MSVRDCLPLEALAALATLPAGDARRAHLDTCPRCRGLLASYELFMGAHAVAGARVDEADAALAAALDRERFPSAARPTSGRTWTGLAALLAPSLRPAWALAAAAVVVFAAWHFTRPAGGPLMRGPGEELARVETLPAVADADSVVLRWKPSAQASGYEVRFFRMDLADLATLPAGTATRAVLRQGALPAGLPEHERVLWQVFALKGRDVLARSRTQPVELP